MTDPRLLIPLSALPGPVPVPVPVGHPCDRRTLRAHPYHMARVEAAGEAT